MPRAGQVCRRVQFHKRSGAEELQTGTRVEDADAAPASPSRGVKPLLRVNLALGRRALDATVAAGDVGDPREAGARRFDDRPGGCRTCPRHVLPLDEWRRADLRVLSYRRAYSVL